jgi:glycerophosphoryl diester phosphodiesterase
MPGFLTIGHRGAAGHEPENTLRAIRRGIELGAGAVEFDTQLVDGRLVVLHDETLNRTTNGKGLLSKASFEELRALDAGRGERIPTLEEAIEAVNHRAIVQIELKGRGTALPAAETIDRFVRDHGWRYDDFLVSSFHHDELAKLTGRNVRLGILFSNSPARFEPLASSLGAYSLHCKAAYATPVLIDHAHRLGLKVFVFTVNEPEAIARLRQAGVDGIFTDFPERAVTA